MRDLNYNLKQLCRNCREGSYATQRNRERILTQIANDLHAMGYRKMQVRSLKPKHIEALVKHWQERELSVGTIKNRMAAIRWWATKVNKRNVMANSNEFYGIPDRRFVTNESKAQDITQTQLSKVKDIHVRMSLELQRAFGLRREEAMKFTPSYADKGDHIQLKASWTKGGKPRIIPIRTQAQREVLDRARALAGFGSLIPPSRSYVQQLRVYEGNTIRAGLSSMHGLRHAYAQERYEELTGWECPATGGPDSKSLTAEQQVLDQDARLTISQELGHEREQITVTYIGR
ncbi:MAG: integrase domain-containing protein [Gammaproteobacteria bacterium]|nr:integrase domain-containing protein [Gammaproteobacteria bacterium]